MTRPVRGRALALLAFGATAQPAFEPAGDHWLPWASASTFDRGRDQGCGIDRAWLDRWTATLHRLGSVWSQTASATGQPGRTRLEPSRKTSLLTVKVNVLTGSGPCVG
jgi:hypothetical protein